MLIDFLIALGAVGIAITIFAIIALLADKPVKAFITALMSAYMLYFTYIYILNRILKRKEEKRATE